MNMEATTVTMDLRRYKELESYEKAVEAMKAKKSFILNVDDWTAMYFDDGEALKEIMERYNAISRRLDRIRTKMRDYKDMPKKPSDLYDFFKDELYY